LTIRAAAVCPQAPALVPEVGHGVAEELADVRNAALVAIDSVLATSPDRIVVLGDGAREHSALEQGALEQGAHEWDESAGGTFRGFGPDVRAGGANLVLPPGHTVGAWLLDVAGWAGPRTYASKLDVEGPEYVGVLVMADGSARHRLLAPEWEDVDGRVFDATIAKALESGDASALASLDLDAAGEFQASGTSGLVALGEATKGTRTVAQLRYEGAPFDVGYWVADWLLNR
jgi:hypothetical protein